jgi:outer membrane protein TolC
MMGTTMTKQWRRGACAMAVLLAGCALPTTPDEVPTAPAPAAWATLQAAPAAERWAGPTDAALQALQERALAANRDIAQALLRWQQAQRQEQFAGLARQPTPALNASAGASRAFDSGARLQRSVSLNLGASYEVDLWQRLAHEQNAAAAQARAAEADWVAARVLVRARVAEAWWTLAAIAAQGAWPCRSKAPSRRWR